MLVILNIKVNIECLLKLTKRDRVCLVHSYQLFYINYNTSLNLCLSCLQYYKIIHIYIWKIVFTCISLPQIQIEYSNLLLNEISIQCKFISTKDVYN